jgi:hypothetical protein
LFGNNFTPHDPCEVNNERQVEDAVQALFPAVDDIPPGVRSCDVQELIISLKLKKACKINYIQNE